MSRQTFSAFNVARGARLEGTHMRAAELASESDADKYEALRREVLDLDELEWIEQQEPPDDWAR
jgi:hypothetical protein